MPNILATAPTLTEILANVQSVLTTALLWVGNIIQYVVTEPYLVIFVVACPMILFAVKLIHSFIRV